MNATENTEQPPFYILVSHSAHSTASAAPTTTLTHPVIEYHYANEGSPHDLLPRTPGEQVLVLDYDPSQITNIFSRSVAGNTAVTGVKVTDAPGAGGADVDPSRNSKMYIIETSVLHEDKYAGSSSSTFIAALCYYALSLKVCGRGHESTDGSRSIQAEVRVRSLPHG